MDRLRRWIVAAGAVLAPLALGACGRCDAPIAMGPGAVPIGAELICPYCDHRGPVREFLSLAAPTRPARVTVRVRLRVS